MESDERTKSRRKKYFLYNSSQPELYGKLLLLFLIILLITGTLFYLLSSKEIEVEWYKAHSALRYVAEMFLHWLIIADIAGIFVVAAFLIFFTHRIAGASFRIRHDLEEIGKGSLTRRIRLRRGDELQDIASALNRTLEAMTGKLERIAGMAADTEMKANAVMHYVGDGDNRVLAREEAARLVTNVRRIREDLQSFIS